MRVEKYSYMRRPSCRRLVWISFSRFLTFFIPNFLLYHGGNLTTAASRQAWREKMALMFLFLFSAGFFCFWLEYISSLFCDPERTYDYESVFSNESRFTAIHGKAVNWHHYEGPDIPMIDYVNQNPHRDLSWNFPNFLDINYDCLYDKEDQIEAWLEHLMATDTGYSFVDGILTQCPLPGARNLTGGPCFHGNEVESTLNSLSIQGDIMYNPVEIEKLYNALPTPTNSTKQAFVILDGYALDVTTYLNIVTNIITLSPIMSSRQFAIERMFLPLDLTLFLYINLGKDITPYFAGNVSNSEIYRKCLVQLFKKGVVPSYVSSGCLRINPALWATMGAGLLYFFIKMNLAYLSRVSFIQRFLFFSAPEVSALNYSSSGSSATTRIWPHTILLVPCFAESSDTLKQTLDSLSRSAYEDDKKLLLFVCDGITTHINEQKETHTLLLEYLGYSCTEDPLPQPYTSLGQGCKRTNYARVYSGYYETGRNRVPYLVIVKLGHLQEKPLQDQKEAPPGNRGKRDSLVLVFGFLERCMNLANNLITPLDYELFNQCYNVLGIDPRSFKYILVTDADIQVQDDVVQKLVIRLEGDRKMLAVSGHVRPANPEENLTTMLQIFPVYMAFYSCLAYEACLRSVMTIQGGLVMYKIWTENVPDQQHIDKFNKKWKLLQQHSNHTSQHSFRHKWPKLSDEIMISNPFKDPSSTRRSSSSDTTMSTTTTSYRRDDSRLSLSARVDIRACCVHPTVLRGIATPQANTMHMQSVLLLGEEKIMPIVLLKSHPGYRLGFEPDAVGYATLPVNFFALQGLQVRNIRAALHNQLEMQRVSWQLGITYWILSTTEILDMIFSMPVIVYLYGIFGRSVKQRAIAYIIIALSFTGLVVLHILFFLFRRQFRYILWFVLYCLLSLPLFAIWFPLVAVWQSDSADQWYDVWPIKKVYHGNSRFHGIIDTSSNITGDVEKEEEEEVPRMRLSEHEVAEAKRIHQAAEDALDSNFTGFTGFVDADVSPSLPGEPEITSPPLAQVRDGLHLTRITTNYRPPSIELYSTTTWRHRYPNERDSPPINPFTDLNDPFDDEYQARDLSQETKRHRQSHSQSSYFTNISRNSLQQDTKMLSPPTDTLPSSLNSSGFAKIDGYQDSMMMTDVSPVAERNQEIQFDRASTTLSIKSNTFSIIAHDSLLEEEENESPRHQRLMQYDYIPRTPGAEEGRKTALHHNFSSSVNLRQQNETRRLVTRHAPSSNSLSRHYDIPNPAISLRTQLSKVNLMTHDMTLPEIQHTVKAEIRSYLSKADLATTTRVQVRLHLAQQFGNIRIDEQDDKMMQFITDCIEDITFELLN